MARAQIFLVDQSAEANAQRITPLAESHYDSEDVLQRFLEDFPQLIPGDQIDPENPRRWLLVKREMGVPDQLDGSGRWSIDHLYLDQDAVPTFVECKRSSDARTRREVVAQMLEYAANGTAHWSADALRAAAEATHRNTVEQRVEDLLGDALGDLDPVGRAEAIEAYWRQVGTNLANGRVRLVFVADALPRELRRMIEFLNDKMADVEIMGVEIRQYVSGEPGRAVLVPRVVGITEAARVAKPGTKGPSPIVDRSAFIESCTESARPIFEQLLDAIAAAGDLIESRPKSLVVRIDHPRADKPLSYAYFTTSGNWDKGPPEAQLYLEYLHLPAPAEAEIRRAAEESGLFVPAGRWTLKAPITDANSRDVATSFERIRSLIVASLEHGG